MITNAGLAFYNMVKRLTINILLFLVYVGLSILIILPLFA